MLILDLFAGKGGELRRKEIEERGHKLVTLDINHSFGCDIKANIMQFNTDTLGEFDLIWASPPCETWSVASIGHHWNKDHTPKTLYAKEAIELVKLTLDVMNAHARIGWVLENPRGMLRTMDFMKPYRRFTTTYCQYGERHMKPTDLWICGLNWKPRPACKNGDPCHERAPRGARTGTQGIKGYADRSIVPTPLWMELIESVENDIARLAQYENPVDDHFNWDTTNG